MQRVKFQTVFASAVMALGLVGFSASADCGKDHGDCKECADKKVKCNKCKKGKECKECELKHKKADAAAAKEEAAPAVEKKAE